MFYVRKENVGTTLGTQKEFAAAQRRNVSFQSDAVASVPGNHVWHYLFPADQVEPSIRATLVPAAAGTPGEDDNLDGMAPEHFIWSQEVRPGELVGEPLISAMPVNEERPWIDVAREKWAAAHGGTAAPRLAAPAEQ